MGVSSYPPTPRKSKLLEFLSRTQAKIIKLIEGRYLNQVILAALK
ncbi:hypothetical protein V5J34_003302 [Endozoicomonas sp. NE35]